MIRKWMSAIASMILLAGIAIPVDAADISSASAGLESGGSWHKSTQTRLRMRPLLPTGTIIP